MKFNPILKCLLLVSTTLSVSYAAPFSTEKQSEIGNPSVLRDFPEEENDIAWYDDTEAQYNRGHLYEQQEGDIEAAIQWYTQAADQNDVDA